MEAVDSAVPVGVTVVEDVDCASVDEDLVEDIS